MNLPWCVEDLTVRMLISESMAAGSNPCNIFPFKKELALAMDKQFQCTISYCTIQIETWK